MKTFNYRHGVSEQTVRVRTENFDAPALPNTFKAEAIKMLKERAAACGWAIVGEPRFDWDGESDHAQLFFKIRGKPEHRTFL